MKETAVEWLVEQLNKQGFVQVVTDEEIKQANKMHEQQIIDAHRHGFTEGTCFGATTIYKFTSAEQYYNETFKEIEKL
jgi:hypothetical protein